ncbi:hypothetical protein BN1708_017316 [Verticillium longisporum]|uniref:Uncharacterized protein n=1 Tax=Verticillium longisporum TaxID=100787 RepID=A0A0G4KYD5_VERLO|nr:hypothetical protein BN1708_017316 [Verticillium longisporum]
MSLPLRVVDLDARRRADDAARRGVAVDAAAVAAANVKDALLAARAGADLAAGGAVVVEEAVEAGAVDLDVARRLDPEAPGHGAGDARVGGGVGAGGALLGKVRVVVGARRREGHRRRRVRLEVGRLGLDLAHVDVARAVKEVLVEHVVLGAAGVEPEAALVALDEHAAARENGDLPVRRVLEVVVRHPHPAVLHQQARRRPRDMHAAPGREARRLNGHRPVRVRRALLEQEIRAGEAADANVHVPHARRLAGDRVEVVLENLGAGRRSARRQDHVRPLDAALVAGVGHLHDGVGLVHIAVARAAAEDRRRQGLADDAGPGGNEDRVGDVVGAGIHKGDETAGCRVGKELVEGGSIVGAAVTLGAKGAGRYECGNGYLPSPSRSTAGGAGK